MIESWMVIALVTFIVAIGSFFITPRDVKWFARLTRPRWLVFEPLIPFIWTFILICGAASAYVVWEKQPGGLITIVLMASYLLLEIITVSYIPLMLRWRSLKVGEIVGAIGVVLGVVLTIFVLPISRLAALLLIPYIVWSPVGTYTTEELIQLNPQDA
ncbi:TspO/MBR family protein [Aetokthonos hydrillicola Thurmond2011]|jgi:tryptophan-rich sensory protein|uniref:TspO/MBR family protein n=1 Tax=Aetokthonos hydrillicola Thurmond2011 TaxID=2712845 RepID=A0AAP5I654_9CYAN|nr:TspO/MBR family protein [Aetokthonos hydrillicola]MBW4589925.1 TspO/MBR family protein [Aetokthonos hydrillicola CCALA 1050]MDR9895748.1 TspO/MBR family protein [Aetokthonos hydrillicola Thurmond2011]